MATKKATKSSPSKKPVTRKAPSAAKTTVRRVSAKPSRSRIRPTLESEKDSFFTFRITHQTLYWLLLSGIVLLLGIWVNNINVQVNQIYDQIDQTNDMMMNVQEKVKQSAQ